MNIRMLSKQTEGDGILSNSQYMNRTGLGLGSFNHALIDLDLSISKHKLTIHVLDPGQHCSHYQIIQIPRSEICAIALEPKNQEEDWEGEIYMSLQDTR